ncbi:hypothetical protein TWF506_008100 [Arthrobotrys conoides]|uniref:Uncharacterized protein n=1 Tax=Arthrobotrys conoides TaxID=74498 RepID=A0AAN8NDX8_9PEZI
MKTSGDRNGTSFSPGSPSFRRVEGRVQKSRQSPRSAKVQGLIAARVVDGTRRRLPSLEAISTAHQEPMEKLCNAYPAVSNCRELLDEGSGLLSAWAAKDRIPRTNDTIADMPVSNSVPASCGDNAVYKILGEFGEARMEIDSEENTRNTKHVEALVEPLEEITASNVSIFSGNSGKEPTSSREIKDFLIEALPMIPARFSKCRHEAFPAEHWRSSMEDPYGNPIHPRDCFPRPAYDVRNLNVDEMFPSGTAHTVGGEAGEQSIGGHSLDATMSSGTALGRPLLIPSGYPIYFVDVEGTFHISAIEAALDASDSGIPYI